MTRRQAALFIESNTSGSGIEFLRTAEEMGFTPFFLTSMPERYAFPKEIVGVAKIICDTSSLKAVSAAADQIALDHSIALVMSTSDHFLSMAAHLAERLGLATSGVDAIEMCRNKARQVELLASAGVNVPKGTVLVSALEDFPSALSEIGLPAVIKPVSGTGSIGVTLANSETEALLAVKQLLSQTVNDRGQNVQPAALISSYVEGPEFSVEILDGYSLGVTKKYLGPLPHFVEMGHDFPADIPKKTYKALESAAQRAITALNLKRGPAHVELRLHGGTPTIIEVNPRLAGGFIPLLIYRATGLDPIKAVLESAVYGRATYSPKTPGSSRFGALRFIVPREDGLFCPTRDQKGGLDMPELADLRFYRAFPVDFKRQNDFRDRLGHVIAISKSPSQAHNVTDTAVHLLSSRKAEDECNTGRISKVLHPEAQEIVFDFDLGRAAKEELPFYAEIDRAQAVMLVESGLMEPKFAARVLDELRRLETGSFEALAERRAPRGIYLAYEEHLRGAVGKLAGNLHLGRSRNDINATLLKLRLREPYSNVTGALIALLQELVAVGRRAIDVPMPLHTHRQPALPSTLGHQLAGFATALERDLSALGVLSEHLNLCPLGAGAGGGSTLPIKPKITAQLLGFQETLSNSIDAVASRDLVLRLHSAVAILGSNLGRISETLFVWLGDTGIATLEDDLVGSSSAMPHKRNAFLLEHVQGKSGSLAGYLTAAITGMQAAPFTNCVAVGTEASAHIWDALRTAEQSVRLIRLCITSLRVDKNAANALMDRSFVNAMEAATKLSLEGRLDFRSAHEAIGRLVSEAADNGAYSIFDTTGADALPGLRQHKEALSPTAIARSANFGGGPGPIACTEVFDGLEEKILRASNRLDQELSAWRSGKQLLRNAVDRLRSHTITYDHIRSKKPPSMKES